jgi:ABC-type uncharacterized transport system ATPase subunit
MPKDNIGELLLWLSEQGVSIQGYRWQEPSLEDVFLNIVGVEA